MVYLLLLIKDLLWNFFNEKESFDNIDDLIDKIKFYKQKDRIRISLWSFFISKS